MSAADLVSDFISSQVVAAEGGGFTPSAVGNDAIDDFLRDKFENALCGLLTAGMTHNSECAIPDCGTKAFHTLFLTEPF